MSTPNTTLVSENNILGSAQENELKEALNIVELEERFEMTAAASDSTRCTYESN